MITQKQQLVAFLIKMRDKQNLYSQKWLDYNKDLQDLIIVKSWDIKEK